MNQSATDEKSGSIGATIELLLQAAALSTHIKSARSEPAAQARVFRQTLACAAGSDPFNPCVVRSSIDKTI
jgi:hypothetical protein